MSRDTVLGVVGLVLAGLYDRMARQLPESLLADAVGPQGLPRIYALVLGVLSLALIGRSLAAARSRGPAEAVRDGGPRAVWRAGGLLALGALYILIVPWLGYVLAIAILIAATTWYQGRTMSPRVVLVSAGGAVLFWLLFVVILGVPHPSGFWSGLR
jgi:hypothetical protein